MKTLEYKSFGGFTDALKSYRKENINTVEDAKAAGTQLIKHLGFTEEEVKAWAKTGGGYMKVDNARKELVPGFGLVMSLQLLNQAYNMQQAQIEETIKLEQENEYGRIQDITFSLYTETTVGDRFDSINRSRWTSLLRNYPLQRLKLYDRGSEENE